MTLSRTGRRGKLRTTWKVRPTPMRQTSKVLRPSICWPASRAEPSSGGSTPFNTLKSVVLPAPFGPMIPRIPPSAIEKLTSLTAFKPPNMRDTSSTSRSGPCVRGAARWGRRGADVGNGGRGGPSEPTVTDGPEQAVGREQHDGDDGNAVHDALDPGEIGAELGL